MTDPVSVERPILFSAPMVRAILEGRKTQTRRVVKSFKHLVPALGEERDCIKDVDGLPSRLDIAPDNWECCPYGVPGDRLWVRESLTHITSDPVTADPCSVHCYTASIPPGMGSASPYEPNYLSPDEEEPNLPPKNIPAIFMPRWASRILLEVTDVRVQRVQGISYEDAIAEGITDPANMQEFPPGVGTGETVVEYCRRRRWPQRQFRELWDSINGARGFGWDANSWVWAISFRHVQ